MRVREVMTCDVVTVTPETSLKEAARKLVDLRISGMPVVGADGAVVGVISEADVLAKERREPEDGGAIARLLHRPDPSENDKLAARVAGEAMTSPAITVEPYWTIPTVAQMMLEHGINRLPVVQAGRLVGIVTRADLVRAFARSDEEIAEEIREALALQEAMSFGRGPVEVRVEAGEATLSGTVGSRDDAVVLANVAGNVPGVVSVRSDIAWSEQ
jgi:CBS-domain-containing membrane protein